MLAIDREPAGAGLRMFRTLLLWVAGTLLGVSTAGVAGDNPADAQARYRQDRAACLGGQSAQDPDTCLREAGAALSEARSGRLGKDENTYEKNRLQRCEPLPQADREDCLRRMRGEGTISGSVEGGGILRELVTRVPAQ